MAKSKRTSNNSNKSSKKKKTEEEPPPPSPASSDDSCGGDADDRAQEVWDVARAYTTAEMDDVDECKTCMTDGCGEVAVAAWASNREPGELWYTCEGCQANDFGGWPEGFVRPTNGVEEEEEEEEVEEEEEEEGDGCDGDADDGAQEVWAIVKAFTMAKVMEMDYVDARRTSMTDGCGEVAVATWVSDTSPSPASSDDSGGGGDADDGDQEVWDIVRDYTMEDMNDVDVRRTCMTDGCSEVSVAAWASVNPPSSATSDESCGGDADDGGQEMWDASSDESYIGDAEDGDKKVWDIVRAYTTAEMDDVGARRTCMTDGCGKVAVAAWSSDMDPGEVWDTCEGCQENDFDGWPEEFERIRRMLIHRRLECLM